MTDPHEQARRLCERLLRDRADDGEVVAVAGELLQVIGELDRADDDLGDQEEAESELAAQLESERVRYRELFERAPEPFVLTDPHGLVHGWNVAAADLLHVRSGMPFVLAVAPAERRSFVRLLERGPVDDEPTVIGFTSVDGVLRMTVQRRDVGSEHVLWALRDVTEIERAHAQLEASAERERLVADQLREIDEIRRGFLLAVTHDLRTPLAAIAGLADLLADGDRLSPTDRAQSIEQIRRSSRHVLALFGDLLDLERLDRQELAMRREDADIGAIIDAVVERTEMGSRTVETTCSIGTGSVDRMLVERIIENLLTNASQHTPDGTHVRIVCRRDPDGIHVVVEDDGPGVPRAERHSVFELFQRRRDGIPGGLGVGLALVRRFAELHGGYARVGERPGGGASFHVLLPEG